MKLGISIYPGLDTSLTENIELLKTAAALGYTRLFTSLQLPECDKNTLQKETSYLLALAENLGFDTIADVSPLTQAYFSLTEITPQVLRKLHISTARFDFGFSSEEIASFSREINIQLNASTIRSRELVSLLKAGADFSHIDGQHNYYPRPHTGLSSETIQRQNALLHRHEIDSGAFVASTSGKRGPLFAGLPSMESLRNIAPADAAPILTAIGCDCLIIADNRPDTKELERFADPETLARADARYSRKALPPKKVWETSEPLTLRCRLLSEKNAVKDLLSHPFTNRRDPAADSIRATESRELTKDILIPPEKNEKKLIIEAPKDSLGAFLGPQALSGNRLSDLLPIGTVTLDNDDYGRYKGELQILTTVQTPDPRTNVIAQIIKEDLPLLSLISAEMPFRLSII